jgi:hypothetical protein
VTRAPPPLQAGDTDKGKETTTWGEAVRTIEISFVSASHGNVVAALAVEVHVQPLTVDRVVRFYQGENQILRRCIRFVPTHALDFSERALREHEDNSKYVHCIDLDEGRKKKVVVEWRQSDGLTVSTTPYRVRHLLSGLFSDP